MSHNTCTISGNLGKDSELRTTASGLEVLTFPLAVNNRRRQSDGTYQDETHWIDCVMFGKRAASLEPYMRRGSKVSLIGHLRQHKWEKDGKTRSRIEVVVDDVELLNGKREAQDAPTPAPVDAASLYDDDIPF